MGCGASQETGQAPANSTQAPQSAPRVSVPIAAPAAEGTVVAPQEIQDQESNLSYPEPPRRARASPEQEVACRPAFSLRVADSRWAALHQWPPLHGAPQSQRPPAATAAISE